MLTLECYWYEVDNLFPRQQRTYQHTNAKILVQQAFLEKMAHLDFVGWRITNESGEILHYEFTKDSQLKKRYGEG